VGQVVQDALLQEREVPMDVKAEFDKLRKTATEGFGQAKELAGGLAEKAVDVVQDRIGAVTGKVAGPEPIRSWNSTVATHLEGKSTVIRLPVEMVELLGWKDKEIVTFSLSEDGSVILKKFISEEKA
jgi:hypothetical protein